MKKATEHSLCATAPRTGDAECALPLTPPQRWLLEHPLRDIENYNLAYLYQLPLGLTEEMLKGALNAIAFRHDALRCRFVGEGQRRRQVCDRTAAVCFKAVDLTSCSGDRADSLRRVLHELRCSLNLDRGPVLLVGTVKVAADLPKRLLIVASHLVYDAHSHRIFMQELNRLCAPGADQQETSPEADPATFRRWVARLKQHADSSEMLGQLPYWTAALVTSAPPAGSDFPATDPSANTYRWSQNARANLSRSLSQRLATLRVPILPVAVAAITAAMWRRTGDPRLYCDLTLHGRHRIFRDLHADDNIGYFSTVAPVLVTARDPSNIPALLKDSIHSVGSMPTGGMGYGLLRYMSESTGVAQRLAGGASPLIKLNYRGITAPLEKRRLFLPAPEVPTGCLHQDNQRRYLMNFEVGFEEGILSIDCKYSSRFHREQTICAMLDDLTDALANIAARLGKSKNHATQQIW